MYILYQKLPMKVSKHCHVILLQMELIIVVVVQQDAIKQSVVVLVRVVII